MVITAAMEGGCLRLTDTEKLVIFLISVNILTTLAMVQCLAVIWPSVIEENTLLTLM